MSNSIKLKQVSAAGYDPGRSAARRRGTKRSADVGKVDWVFQMDAAEQDVGRLLGLTGVTRAIETPTDSAGSERGNAVSRVERPDAVHIAAWAMR